MGILNSVFGKSERSQKLQGMVKVGAVIIDVRTPAEFGTGHVEGSINYPLQSIPDYLVDIQLLNKPVILCCASGNRSGQATNFLRSKGVDCENGGAWGAVQKMISELA